MSKDRRVEQIRELEKVRGSRIIAYLTGDRGIAATPIADDVLRIVYDHLMAIGHVDQIDMVIYSRGGDAMLPWPLVNTIRSFSKRFCVLVPFRAHSAATLIGLGADEIVMTPIAQLTPVEPTITMPFNPPDPANPGRQLGINVEDVAAFMQFVRERADIASEAGLTQAMTLLAQQVHPIALGNLHRAHRLAKQQAEKLLNLHMDPALEHGQISEIVDNVVSKLWAHEYKIGRREARDLGLKAVDATADVEAALWKLFEAYEVAMELRKPINPATAFQPGEAKATLQDLTLAYVESTERTDAYRFDMELNRPLAPTPPGQPQQFGPQVQVTITRQEWVQE
jgi:Serine dehydrogenase proteinase